jgi:LysM repeat protein
MSTRTAKLILAFSLMGLLIVVSVASVAMNARKSEAASPAASSQQQERIHIVRRGETLAMIARRYGVSMNAIIRLNGIRNPNFIYVGQVLRIPGPAATPTPTPPPTHTPVPPTATPVAGLCPPAEAIIIQNPTQGLTITSPVTVTGVGSGFEQQLTVRVLDEMGAEIGSGTALIGAEPGQSGPFTGTVTFTVPSRAQMGRIQVFSVSRRDGAIEHLSSVSIHLAAQRPAMPESAATPTPEVKASPTPSELETLIAAVKAALESKDYPTLQAAMPEDNFVIGFYLSEGQSLTPAQAIEEMRLNYLGPGAVKVDTNKDALRLLGDRASFGATVRAVIFSTGWGQRAKDDGFLIFEEIEGHIYWSAMLYVREETRDY